MAFGCVKEADHQPLEKDQEILHEVVFHAGWAPETRTVLQEDGSIWWSPGDEIQLCFPLKEKKEDPRICPQITFVCKTENNAPVADFYIDMEYPNNRGSYKAYCDKKDLGLVGDTFYALYPNRGDNSNYILYTSEEKLIVHFSIPPVQIATQGSFDKNAFVSIAESNDNYLSFRNLCGGIKFSVSQEGIKEVSFRYTGDIRPMLKWDSLAFEYKNGYVGGPMPDEVVVRAPENSYFEVGKYYYAALLPFESENPLSVTFKKDDSQATYVTEGPTVIKRSVVKRLYEKDKDLSFGPLIDGGLMLSTHPLDTSVWEEITEVYFHPSNNRITEVNLGTEDSPVYYERIGSIVHYYTPKSSFNLRNVAHGMFHGCSYLTKVDLSGVNTSEVIDFSNFFYNCRSLKEVNVSGFDTSSALDMSWMFDSCTSLEILDLSSFNTSHVVNMCQMFAGCINLRDLNLGSFDTGRCTDMRFMFYGCISLEKLDLKSFDVSSVTNASYMCKSFAIHRKHCAVRASEQTKKLMCRYYETHMSEQAIFNWILWITPNEEFPEITDPFADLYKSTDYSRDMTYKKIQTATKGKGLDIVIMGDAYSDRLIENGKYDQDLSSAVEHIFSEEPLRSLRDYFNIYIAYAVSEHETPTGRTAFDIVFNSFPQEVMVSDFLVDDYLEAVLPNYGWEFLNGDPLPYTIIVSNYHSHDGVCRFYSCGDAMVMTTLGLDDTDFHYVMCHEFGHAIGLLADEYVNGGYTFENHEVFINESANGRWANVDITNDPNSVKWNRFLSDERYSNQGLGLYEGGLEMYAYGIWRSTENSLMRDATTGFNAPSREAIYKRVHELAEDSFVYDYEQFVEFDLAAMKKEPSAVLKRVRPGSVQTGRHLPSPIFIEGASNPYGASKTITYYR